MLNFAETIKQRLTMGQMLGVYGIAVNEHGFAKCPFHNEKTASFKAYDGDRGYYCFGCGESGDVITFVMRLFGLSFKAALRKIDTDFGLCLFEKPTLAEFRKAQRVMEAQKEKREREKQDKEVMEAAYRLVHGEWKRLMQNKAQYAPKEPTEEWDVRFTEALEKLALQEYILDIAAGRR